MIDMVMQVRIKVSAAVAVQMALVLKIYLVRFSEVAVEERIQMRLKKGTIYNIR